MNNIDSLNRTLAKLMKEPNNIDYMNDIAIMLYQFDDLENAEHYLKRAYELSPCNQDVLFNYALVLETQGKWKEAIQFYKEYLKLFSSELAIVEKIQELSYRFGEYEIVDITRKELL